MLILPQLSQGGTWGKKYNGRSESRPATMLLTLAHAWSAAQDFRLGSMSIDHVTQLQNQGQKDPAQTCKDFCHPTITC